MLARVNGEQQVRVERDAINTDISMEKDGLRELQQGIRRALFIGVVLMVHSQINGVNMMLFYTSTSFKEAGVINASDSILSSVYVPIWITLCTVFSFWLIARFGRRPILIIGPVGMALGEVTMFCKFAYALPPWAALAGMLLATDAFTLTLAPLSWVVLSELFPNRVRGTAMGCG